MGISTTVIDTGLGPQDQHPPIAGNGESAEDRSIALGQREGCQKFKAGLGEILSLSTASLWDGAEENESDSSQVGTVER